MRDLVISVWAIVGVLFLAICNGSAFLGDQPPMWRWPRPAGAPEWETDVNGKVCVIFTWCATIMDLAIAGWAGLWAVKWSIESWLMWD